MDKDLANKQRKRSDESKYQPSVVFILILNFVCFVATSLSI